MDALTAMFAGRYIRDALDEMLARLEKRFPVA
jgi:hypothetical protein